MSVFDLLFIIVYCLCGLAVGFFSAKHFGPVCGILGFVVGFAGGMILWRCIAKILITPKKPPLNREENKILDKDQIKKD